MEGYAVPNANYTMIFTCLILGYAFGMILTAVVVVRKFYHASIFEVGSKNPGLANVAIEYGIKPALLVMVGDSVKVLVPTLIVRALFPDEPYMLTTLLVGLGATLGHNYPCWHKFKGGEGVMTTNSAIILASPWWGILAVALGFVFVLITQYLNPAAVAICIFFNIFMYYTAPFPDFLITLIYTALMFIANYHAIAKIFTDEREGEKVDVAGLLKKKMNKK